MRIGVVSDSHGRMDFLRDAVKEMHDIDYLIHAGDHYKDAMALKDQIKIPVFAVKGNCDWYSQGPEEEFLEIEGHKILITHGHNYGVKSDNSLLAKKVQNEGLDLIIFGHTHIPEVVPVGRAYLLNPGSIAKPRMGHGRTYGILEIHKDSFHPYIKEAIG